MARTMAGLYSPEPLKLSDWADKHFYLSPESSAVSGAWETLPYQRAIMNAISNDDIRIITLMKSARVGYTKIISAAMGYFAEHKKRNQLIYQPTDSDAKEFVKDEIEPILRDVPIVRAILKADPEKRSKDNTIQKKCFVGSTLDIRGGKSARNYRRMTKDVVYYDELDGFDQDVEGEGSPTSLGDTRTIASSFRKSIRGSTPSVKNQSGIEASLSDADKVFSRYLPCPSCSEYQPLTWAQIKFVDNDYTTAMHACLKCGALAEYGQYADMDKRGEWRSEDGTWIDEQDLFRNKDGSIADAPLHVGFFIWGGYSYYSTWADTVHEWIKANAAKKRGDVGPLKTFINTRLAETWEEEGERPLWAEVKARADPYSMLTVPAGGCFLTCGVDTQDNRLALVVRAWGRGQESWLVYWKELYGDPALPDVWAQLDAVLVMKFRHDLGQALGIIATAIDTGGHRTQDVYNYVRFRRHLNVKAVKGSSSSNRPVQGRMTYQDVDWKGTRVKNGVELWSIGTDTGKSAIYNRLKLQTGPGCMHTPIGTPDEYYEGLTAEKLTTRMHKGFEIREWVKIAPRNEPLDCENYAYFAALSVGMEWQNWDVLEASLGSSKGLSATPTAQSHGGRRTRSSGVR